MKHLIRLLTVAFIILLSCKTNSGNNQTKTVMATETEMSTKQTLEAVEKFNAAINNHDINAVMNAMTDDCVFDNTNPAPDGSRFAGASAVRAFWEKFFSSNPDAKFETEEIFATGDRCVDVFKIRNGKVAEKLAYVKG